MRLCCSALSLALIAVPSNAGGQEPNAYSAAVEARREGKPAEAKRLLQEWLTIHPDDVDARLQLAYAELALGNLTTARAGFEEVLRMAPDYADARDGLRLVSARQARPVRARAGEILLEGALSDLSGPAENWRELAIDAAVPTGDTTALGARVAYHRRFQLEDLELTGRIDWRASDRLALRAHIGGTPKANFRPELSLGGGADLRVSGGTATVLTFDAKYDRFPRQGVVTVSPGLIRYLVHGRGWMTLRGIGTLAEGGPLLAGASLRGDYVPVEGWRLFAGVANGPDTDLGVVTRTTTLFGGVTAPLSDRLGLVGSIARDWRETGADRTEFRIGVKIGL